MATIPIENGRRVTDMASVTAANANDNMILHDGNGMKKISYWNVVSPEPREITLTWDEISAKTKKGDFSGLRIGDYKTVTLTTGEVVIMEIAGIDPYFGSADQEAGHHILWVSRDCLATTYQMRSDDTNNGTSAEPNPYRASALFSILQNTIFPTVPAEIRAHVIEMYGLLEHRYSGSGTLNNSVSWSLYSRGKAILLTPIEVFGTEGWGEIGWSNGCGVNVHLPLFSGSSKHFIKHKVNGGARASWWLAAAGAGNSATFCRVGDDGTSTSGNASSSFGVPLSFFTY